MVDRILEWADKEIQICTNLQLADTMKETWVFQKEGFPLEPRYAGMCKFSTKNFETRAVQFETRACMISFLYQNHQDTIQDSRLI
jgi:hypothetical protein